MFSSGCSSGRSSWFSLYEIINLTLFLAHPSLRFAGAEALAIAPRFTSLSGALKCHNRKAYRPDGSASGLFYVNNICNVAVVEILNKSFQITAQKLRRLDS